MLEDDKEKSVNDKPKPRTQYRQFAVLGQLVPYIRNSPWLIVSWLACLAISTAATLLLPIAARSIIANGFQSVSTNLINRSFIILLILVLLIAVSGAVRDFSISLVSERAVNQIRSTLYRHVVHLDVEFFDRNRVGELLSRLATDTEIVQTLVGSSVSGALRGGVTVIGASALMVWTSPKLAALTAIVLPLVIAPILAYGPRVTRLSRKNQDCVADTSAIADEVLNAISLVKAYGHERAESARYSRAVRRTLQAATNRIGAEAILSGGVLALVFCAIVCVLWYGAFSVVRGTLSDGQLVQFLMYALVVASSVGALAQVWGHLLRASGSMGRIAELHTETSTIVDADKPVMIVANEISGEIDIKDVVFTYPNSGGVAAIDHFSLLIPAKATVALVGPSGGGKSTIFKLLLRFYDPQAGCIKVNDIDIRNIRITDLRSLFSIVPQDPTLFATSIAWNIRYGRSTATEPEVREAAQAADALGFISDQPDGFDTLLGEHGSRLSGGQRQRLTIARAILKRSHIMLLDEATSDLDARSGAAIQRALMADKGRRTTIIIAHRLSTVLRADLIAVVDRGRVIACGNHQTLMRDCKLYAELAEFEFVKSM